MATVLLIRHATTAATGKRLGGRTDAPLDDAGRRQAMATAARLADLPIRAVYASPLARTFETAQIVAAPHRLKVRPCEDVIEIEYGRWTDRPLKPLTRNKLWAVIQARPSLVRFPDGETIRYAQLRAVDALEEIAARHRSGIVAVVSHADIIKAIVAFYAGMPLDAFQRLYVGPSSVTVLAVSDGARPMLLRFNDEGPLQRQAFMRPRKPPPKKAPVKRASRRGSPGAAATGKGEELRSGLGSPRGEGGGAAATGGRESRKGGNG
ncbi:MAG: histidine phosphatase family protein [Egibacteraceae bacterium]